MAVAYTPREGSFLWVVAQSHPNAQVRCGNNVGLAGSVAHEVAAMLAEIEELRSDRALLERVVKALERAESLRGMPERGDNS